MSISTYDFWLTLITLLATGVTIITGIALGFLISGSLWSIFWLRLQRKHEEVKRNTVKASMPATVQTKEIPSALPMRPTGAISVMKDVRRGAALSVHGKRR